MSNLQNVETFGPSGELRMIVETPRCSTVKLKYEPRLELFTISRALPLGLAYPFDWGFIPGTLGEDGDPLDALALHDAATYPGVMLPCRPLGMVELKQKDKNGWQANPRLILMPLWHDRLGELEKAAQLPERLKAEIERFFLSADFFTCKHPKIESWKGPHTAEKAIRDALLK
jgi:inorganic pyrophosphatase